MDDIPNPAPQANAIPVQSVTQQNSIPLQSVQSMDKPNLPFARLMLAPLVFFIFGVIFIPALLMLTYPKNDWMRIRRSVANFLTGKDYVIVKNQPFGSQFIVRHVRMRKPGYLVLITSDQFDSPNQNIVGTSTYLTAGSHSKVPIFVNAEAKMDDPATHSLVPLGPPFWQPGATVFIGITEQDAEEPMGDGVVWDWAKDRGGVPVTAIARVL